MCGINFQAIWRVSLKKNRHNETPCANIARVGSFLNTSHTLEAERAIISCMFHSYQLDSPWINSSWEQAIKFEGCELDINKKICFRERCNLLHILRKIIPVFQFLQESTIIPSFLDAWKWNGRLMKKRTIIPYLNLIFIWFWPRMKDVFLK